MLILWEGFFHYCHSHTLNLKATVAIIKLRSDTAPSIKTFFVVPWRYSKVSRTSTIGCFLLVFQEKKMQNISRESPHASVLVYGSYQSSRQEKAIWGLSRGCFAVNIWIRKIRNWHLVFIAKNVQVINFILHRRLNTLCFLLTATFI